MYAPYGMMDIVYDRSELITYPEKLLSAFEKIFEDQVNRQVTEQIQYYAQMYGQSYSKKEMREILYPNGSDTTYIEEGAKNATYQYLVVKMVQKELGIAYTDEDYQNDLQTMADEYTAYYGEAYTARDIEKLYGEELLRLSFIETLVSDALMERISGMPEIPQVGDEESWI